jgi:hypothetical protein
VTQTSKTPPHIEKTRYVTKVAKRGVIEEHGVEREEQQE